MNALLAFDTATECMSVALAVGAEVSVHESEGGALASASLLPAILELLARAGLKVRDLDAIAFGRGPGAFTGLRTACSVAQGLALGAARPVLPIDTLLAVAEDARTAAHADAGATAGAADRSPMWVAMDARMDEIYAARYAFADGGWQVLDAPMLITPEALNQRWDEEAPRAVAGSALGAFGERLQTRQAARFAAALPRARGMIPLARALWAADGAVDAALALPLYLRDKVAQTSAERDALRASRGDPAVPLR